MSSASNQPLPVPIHLQPDPHPEWVRQLANFGER